jgi:hypothetical protein
MSLNSCAAAGARAEAPVASYFEGEEKADQEKTELNQRLDRIEAMLAQALATPGKPVAAIASDETERTDRGLVLVFGG